MHSIVFQLIWAILHSVTGKRRVKLLQVLRNDNAGHGHFGAKRGLRSHNGVDIVSFPGEEIYAPIDLKVERTSKAGKASKTSGIQFTPKDSSLGSSGFIWYFEPYSNVIGEDVLAGTPIGKAQDMVTLDYPHLDGIMKNHVHVEHRDEYGDAINIQGLYL